MKKRIVELDFFRGLALIAMMVYHTLGLLSFHMNPDLNITIDIRKFMNSNFVNILVILFLFIFFLISGISSTLSKKPKKRCLELVLVAISITLLTYVINFFNNNISIIYLGVIHIYFLCSLFSLLLKKINNLYVLLFGILIIIFYYFTKNIEFNSNLFYILGYRGKRLLNEGEYFGLFPYLGYYLIGIFIGRKVYKVKETKIKILDHKVFSLINYIGKYSMYFYLIQFILIIIFDIILS